VEVWDVCLGVGVAGTERGGEGGGGGKREGGVKLGWKRRYWIWSGCGLRRRGELGGIWAALRRWVFEGCGLRKWYGHGGTRFTA